MQASSRATRRFYQCWICVLVTNGWSTYVSKRHAIGEKRRVERAGHLCIGGRLREDSTIVRQIGINCGVQVSNA